MPTKVGLWFYNPNSSNLKNVILLKMQLFFRTPKYLVLLNKYQKCLSKNVPSKCRFYSTSSDYILDLKIQGISLKNYISSLEKEYQSTSNGTLRLSDFRRRELEPVIRILTERNKIIGNIKNLKELLESNDGDLKKLAEQEKQEFENKIKELEENLLFALIPKDTEERFDSLILEVQAGVGGQEAMLFAKEVFEMYQKYIVFKGNTK